MVAFNITEVLTSTSESNDNIISVNHNGVNGGEFVLIAVQTALSVAPHPSEVTISINGVEIPIQISGFSQRNLVTRMVVYSGYIPLGVPSGPGAITVELGYTSTRKNLCVAFYEGSNTSPYSFISTGTEVSENSTDNKGATGGQLEPRYLKWEDSAPGVHIGMFFFGGELGDVPLPAGWNLIAKVATNSPSVRRGFLLAYRYHRETDHCITKYSSVLTQQWAMVSFKSSVEMPPVGNTTFNVVNDPVLENAPVAGASVIIAGNKVPVKKTYVVLNGNRYPLEVS